EGWTPVKSIVWRIRSHPQEVGENTVDTAHMRPVHRTEPSRVRSGPELKGALMELSLAFLAPGELVGMEGDNDVQLDIEMYGLGQIQVTSHVLNAGITARYWVNSTPIDRENIDIHGVVSVQYGDDRAFTEEVAELFFEAFTTDFVKDFPIWENKLYRHRPVLSAADGPIGMYRKWAKQFYLDPATTSTNKQVRAGGTRQKEGRVAGALVSVKGLIARVRAAVPGRRRQSRSDSSLNGQGNASTNGASSQAQPRASTTKPTPATAAPQLQVESATHYRETLAQRFVATAAKGIDAVFQWELSGEHGQTFHAVVRDGAVTVVEGAHEAPTVTLAMAADDYVKVVNGELDGTKAFTSGKGKVSGKIRLAMKMRKIFPQ
ncbi:MAG: SCP2 sterol-binding domain-containing protein, partial [Nannocystaceae bacterium]